MPELPEKAVQAAWRYATSQPLLWQYVSEGDVRDLLVAAAPAIAAQAVAEERRKMAEELRRVAQGRREYDKGEPPAHMHEVLVIEAGAFESAARLVEDPMVMLGLIPYWMWTDEEEARLDENRAARQIGEASDSR